MMAHLPFNKLIKFQNDHISQHNRFINVDKKYPHTFLSKNVAIKRYYGDYLAPNIKVHQTNLFYTTMT